MTSSSFFKSARAARGRPQLATCSALSESVPLHVRLLNQPVPRSECLAEIPQLTRPENMADGRYALKKYSLAAGERSQLTKVEAILCEMRRGREID